MKNLWLLKLCPLTSILLKKQTIAKDKKFNCLNLISEIEYSKIINIFIINLIFIFILYNVSDL